MSIATTCHNCDTVYNNVSSDLAGKLVKCPKCGNTFRVKAQSTEIKGFFDTICPHCQARYRNLKPEHAGKTARCEKCGQRFRVELLSQDDTGKRPPESEKPQPEPALTMASVVQEPSESDSDEQDGRPQENPPDNDTAVKLGIEWTPGEVLMGLYEVAGVLGEGGMGKVYMVHHRGWDMDLAMKVPKTEVINAAGGVNSFEREAETWVNLGLHPNIVSCYYIRRIQDLPLVFTEYVGGGSLNHWIKSSGGELPRLYQGEPDQVIERILDIAIQFAWGLDYAHEQGLIHQDVKPANVMMTSAGMAKVTDFGLAIPRAQAEESEAASDEQDNNNKGMVIGTPAYFAPEQAIGGTLTPKIDLWSWALSILEMFMGERSWKSGTIAPEILEEYISSGSDIKYIPRMPDSLTTLLRSCLKPSPRERPGNLKEAADTLMGIYEKIVQKPYPRPEPKAGKSVADNLNNTAVSLMDLGRQEEAERLWENALKSQPHHPGSTYSRGMILWRSGRMTDETLAKQMEEVLRSHPEDWVNHYLLGLVHLERDDCHEALRTFQNLNQPGGQLKEVEASIQRAKACLPASRGLLRAFDGHTANVNAVHVSQDGLWALSGSDDRTIRLWEVETGRCIHTFEGSAGEINSICLSRDKRYILSGSGGYTRNDFSVRLWDVSSGRCLRTFKGHDANVNTVCFNKDARLLVSGGDEGIIKVWEIETGQCLQTIRGHKRAVTAVRLTEDGRYILSASADKTIRLWNAETGRGQFSFEGHAGTVTSISLAGNGQYMLSGSADHTLKLWDFSARNLLRTYSGHSDEVTSVSITPDGRHAVSGGLDNTVRLWEIETGRCLRTFFGHQSWVLTVCLSRDGKFALSGSVGGKINQWRTNRDANPELSPLTLSRILTSETVLTAEVNYENHLEKARRYLEEEDLPRAVNHIREARAQKGFSRGVKAIKAWTDLYKRAPHKTLNGGWEEASLKGHESWIRAVTLSQNGEYALSGGVDGALKVWDLVTKRCLKTLRGHAGGVLDLCLSKDNNHALSGSNDQTLKLWRINTESCLRTLEGHTANVNSVRLSNDTQLGLSGSEDRTIRLWDVSSGRCLRIFAGHLCAINSVCLSLDERFILSGSGDHTLKENALKLWDITTGSCLRTFEGHEGVVNEVSLTHDCQYAFSGSGDTTLKMWEISTGDCVRTFTGHSQAVNTIRLSRDERYLLSGSSDNTLKVWDINSGRCLRTFEGHTGGVSSACLSHNGQHIISGGEDNTLKIWILDWELEGRELAGWDEGAMSYLHTFLTTHMPYAGKLPQEGEVTEEEIQQRLTRHGKPSWTDEDFKDLLDIIGWAGYGWLRPEGIKINLDYMARRWQGPSELELEKKRIETPARKKLPEKREQGVIKRWIKGAGKIFSQ
ncbi:MAG: protein kinase [Deltaproteobacteria bacterium]|nr:protein kinase [Deltaproteobacteria bacterium]